jgi:hypothetical protein
MEAQRKTIFHTVCQCVLRLCLCLSLSLRLFSFLVILHLSLSACVLHFPPCPSLLLLLSQLTLGHNASPMAVQVSAETSSWSHIYPDKKFCLAPFQARTSWSPVNWLLLEQKSILDPISCSVIEGRYQPVQKYSFRGLEVWLKWYSTCLACQAQHSRGCKWDYHQKLS